MPRAIGDLSGLTFGRWTVLRFEGRNKHAQILWRCRCLCGTEKAVNGSALRLGSSTNCGCWRRGRPNLKFKDLTEQKIGCWTVITRSGSDKWHNIIWKCRCVCGLEKDIRSRDLSRYKTVACTHTRPEGHITDTGYRLLYRPLHPNARSQGYVLEHIAIMSEILQRPLVIGETVHHKNTIRSDNNPDNLELWYVSQPAGARVTDLIDYVTKYHRKAVESALVSEN